MDKIPENIYAAQKYYSTYPVTHEGATSYCPGIFVGCCRVLTLHLVIMDYLAPIINPPTPRDHSTLSFSLGLSRGLTSDIGFGFFGLFSCI